MPTEELEYDLKLRWMWIIHGQSWQMRRKNDTCSKALSLNCGRQIGEGNNLHLRNGSYTSPRLRSLLNPAGILLLDISGMYLHSMYLDMLNVRLEVSNGVCKREYVRS